MLEIPSKKQKNPGISYELAKKLKDTGFVQPINPEERLPVDGIYTQMGSDGESVYKPTLSELIEACGERFGKLEYTPEISMNPWWAHERLKGVHMTGDGLTPEEAIANLWLAIKPTRGTALVN